MSNAKQIDQLLEGFLKRGLPGCGLKVVQYGNTLYEGYFCLLYTSVKWINTDQGKQCKPNISNHADQFINRSGIFFYFSILFHVHILTSI